MATTNTTSHNHIVSDVLNAAASLVNTGHTAEGAIMIAVDAIRPTNAGLVFADAIEAAEAAGCTLPNIANSRVALASQLIYAANCANGTFTTAA